MQKRLVIYVAGISVAGCLAFATLYRLYPVTEPTAVGALLLLSSLAAFAELLAFVMPNAAVRGSIAFIPYLASVVVIPNWTVVLAVCAVKSLVELVRRAPPNKALFNVAQHALVTSLAVLGYRALGGISLLDVPQSSISGVTIAAGLPAIITFSSSLFANTLIVSAVIAVSNQKSVLAVWRQAALPSIGMDLVAGPLIFVFAWLYAKHGPIAAAALWVPILGIREVHRVNIQLQRTNEELLQLMVKSIEARDPYTSGHSRRVQHYSTVIARCIGLSEKQIERISRAALLHDVGKIYEKYAPILRKADKLNPDEWATMQEHPIDGANLVSTMSGLKDIIPAIRHHHENWDGSGYPDGLTGDSIPLESRIISFADTIDAMTSERPYRQPLSEAQVRAEFIRCRGRQFDPMIADKLLASQNWHTLFQPPKRTATPKRGLALIVNSGRGIA